MIFQLWLNVEWAPAKIWRCFVSMLVDQTANVVLWNHSVVVWERYGAIYGGNGSQMLHSWVVWLQLSVHGGRIRNESSNKS